MSQNLSTHPSSRSRGRRSLVRAGALALALASAGQAAAQDSVTTTQLADDLYLLQAGRDGNVVLSLSEHSAVLVDAQTAAAAPAVAAAVAGLTDVPVEMVLTTHYHDDHLGGNEYFRSRGATVLSHSNVPRQASADTFIAALNWTRKAAKPEALPDELIELDLEIRPGGRAISVFHFPAAHTDGDLGVFFPVANVLHAGDIVEIGAYPFVDWWAGGSLDGMIEAVGRISEIADEETKIVPGHGAVIDRAQLLAYLEMLTVVRERLAAALQREDDLETIMLNSPVAEFDAENGGPAAGRRFVGVLYLGLTGDHTP